MSEFLKELTDKSRTQNGHQRLPGGLILQWGNTPAIAAGASGVITYPIPFPNGVFTVVATGGGNGNTTTPSGLVVETAASKVNFTARNWGGNTLAAGGWIAIGY